MSPLYFSRRRRFSKRWLFAAAAAGLAIFLVIHLRGGDDDQSGAIPGATLEALDAGRRFLSQEPPDPDAARAALEPLVAPNASAAGALDALLLLAKAEGMQGHDDKALDLLKRAAADFPHSPKAPEARTAYACALEKAGQDAEAARVYALVRDNAPPELRASAETGLGRLAERRGDFQQAQRLYRQASKDAAWDSAAWFDATQRLGRVNVALIFSPEETYESRRYVVRSGDTLINIGVTLNATLAQLTRANRIYEDMQLRPGMTLKYTPKDFHIVVGRAENRLFLLDKDGVFIWYPCTLSKPQDGVALGRYRIGNKQRAEMNACPMPLLPDHGELPTNLGLYYATQTNASGILLQNKDLDELFDLVARSTSVEIVEHMNSNVVNATW